MYFHEVANHYGGIFTLAPPEAANPDGHIFPPTFSSLASSYFTYLLPLGGGGTCVTSASLGVAARYDGGILCRAPLRPLRVYTRDLSNGTAPRLHVEVYEGSTKVARARVCSMPRAARACTPWHVNGACRLRACPP